MYQIYQINYGDTLESIANKFDISIDELNRINASINNEVGSYIIVPRKNSDIFETYTIKAGDTLYSIASMYSITPDILASINGIKLDDYLYPNQEIIVPSSGIKIYITKDNDTIDTLINNFNTTYEELLKQNKKLYLVTDQLVIFKDNEVFI